uniref:Calcineurin-like phosphoesterase domain-containing protein n=1 Tax=Tetraselmis chuii TaxID=63592 RepID=A0A7S1SNL2_9CHLO|mmetsp:Transcript_21607/g.38526  ORF Transcript_21607/g.38526 Transcript_21607/m.38526 type:complete len:440 (+) Transcript_21607:51-1370(+)
MMADRRPSTASHKHLVTIIWHADVITRIGSNLLPVFCGLLLLLAVQGNAAPHPILDAASHLDRDRGLLRFDSGGSFKILQLTDLHFGESASKDRRSVQVMEAVLQAEANCSLVLLSGDMVSGNLWERLGRPKHFYQRRWEQLVAPLKRAGVPYAVVLGNHDGEADLSRRQVVELVHHEGGSLSLTRMGPHSDSSAGNYWLDVMSSSGDGRVALRVWMLDSRRIECNGHPGWGCVAPEIIAWVAEKGADLPRAPSIAVVHIPPAQFMYGWSFGGGGVGLKREPVNCPAVETGLHAALRAAGVQLVLSGHDHNNNFVTTYDGITYAYGQKTGYGSYGPLPGLLRGGRLLLFQEGEKGTVDVSGAESWLRLEDGTLVVQESSRRSMRTFQMICDGGYTGGALALLARAKKVSILVVLIAVVCVLCFIVMRRKQQKADTRRAL